MLMRKSTSFVVKDSTGRVRTLPHNKPTADRLASRIELDTLEWYSTHRPQMPSAELAAAARMRVVVA
jgi:hypothetical protein